ncbi:GNAT family N-acetyltransferase [Paraurantiacibacter namhicola]|uniref:N-acetyltransferase domain-containing protein n=1 Tax=Paraurantiacibacter namhicola TaxID=645517 RepID=A0A1C7D803_9SPHN|nr:GNAT family protein [Paraurantiacibacter namhicola]ANU07604.1 hypothetical protein A6F65_01298 [Paraurantiacibacter namhicola]
MKHQVTTLTTERFSLRPIRAEDTAALYPTFRDEAQMRYWSRGPFASEAELDGWLRDPTWDGHCWIAEETGGNGQAIARLVAIPDMDGVMETGYLVAKHRQGEGIARECMTALLDHLFAPKAEGNGGGYGLRRVWADTDPENAPSNALLVCLGFMREGRLRSQWETHIGVRDSLVWGLLREEWNG